jgi:hypothetical protein
MNGKGWILLGTGAALAFVGANMSVLAMSLGASGSRQVFLTLGAVAFLIGVALARRSRRGLHHSATDPIGFGLVILGILVVVFAGRVVGGLDPFLVLFNGVAAVGLGGGLLAKKGGGGF